MAADVYGLDTQIGGAWQLEGAVLNIEGGEDLIITNATISYQRGVTKFSPLNQKKRYMATGEADGQITLGAVIGPSKGIKDFITKFSDACSINSNVLSIQPAGIKPCDGGATTLKFKCTGCLLNSLQVTTSQIGANLTLVSAGMSFSFIGMQLT